MATKVARKPESRADILFRALQRAREQGCTLLMEGESETWFCTSGTVDNIIYAVSEQGCSCMGFQRFGHCKHFALLLDHRGMRPPTATELEAAIAERDHWNACAAAGEITSADAWRWVFTVRQRTERMLQLATPPEPTPPAVALPVPVAAPLAA